DYTYAFFTGGGGDESRQFGHSNSQPVLAGENCELMLDNVYIIDNPGKAMGFRTSEVDMTISLISRCDTGGELEETRLHFEDCYFLDIPNDNSIEVDDDNDALYVHYPWTNGEDRSVIRNCVFITGKDDGIDQNETDLLISGCIIEDFDNEGIAASTSGEVEVLNTLVLRCEQGIEAGYGSPQVFVNHCVCLENEIGVRFGDSYDWGCTGILNVTNSIVTGNSHHNVWNYDFLLGGPREGAISVTYSIVNQADYDDGEGCMTGVPQFTSDYRLQPDSPGSNAASDSLDMGLLPM
ncbi:right-handed parallel beta-helix repeat-containing protein, partial [bacterium]|nr:right-handed parallel beta-helix repeat-containing protein [bacterium]